MKPYTKTYMNHFGYDISSFIPCELCNSKAVDIHHIRPRSTHKQLENEITNLQALCRSCHTKFGDNRQHRDMLQSVHNSHLKKIAA